MSANPSLSVACLDSPTGSHEWVAITIQRGTIVGVDDTGAPVFIPENTADREPDSPCYPTPAYGCDHCSEPWIGTSGGTSI